MAVLYSRGFFRAFYLILISYIGLRLWGLTSSCLWFDEIFSVHAAEHSWGGLWNFAASDLIHPPLFYAVLKLWVAIGGESVLWLRLLPVFFSVVAVYPFLRLCSELLRGLRVWPMVLAFFLFAVNGSLIKYAQEVRMYSMLMCLSLFSFWLFTRYLHESKGFAVLAAVNVLLVWTHYFGWLVIASELAAVLIFQKSKWRGVAAAALAAFVSFVPWAMAIAGAAGENAVGQNIGWMQRPGLTAIMQFKLALVEPFYFRGSNVDPVSIYRVSVPLLLIAAVAMVFWFANWTRHQRDERRAFELAAIFAAVPMLTTLVLSWLLPYSIWGARHLIIVFAPVSIVLALTLSRISWWQIKDASVTLVIIFTMYAFVLRATRPDPEYIWCAWEQLLDKIDDTRDINVYAAEDVIAYHLWFAARRNPKVHIFRIDAGMPEDKAYFLPRGFNDVERVAADDLSGEDIWLAYRTGMDTAQVELPSTISQQGIAAEQTFEIDLQNTRALLSRLRKP